MIVRRALTVLKSSYKHAAMHASSDLWAFWWACVKARELWVCFAAFIRVSDTSPSTSSHLFIFQGCTCALFFFNLRFKNTGLLSFKGPQGIKAKQQNCHTHHHFTCYYFPLILNPELEISTVHVQVVCVALQVTSFHSKQCYLCC